MKLRCPLELSFSSRVFRKLGLFPQGGELQYNSGTQPYTANARYHYVCFMGCRLDHVLLDVSDYMEGLFQLIGVILVTRLDLV